MAPSDCSRASLKMIRAPKCRAIRLRASLTLPGITSATGMWSAAPIHAYAIPVLPLVESSSVLPRRVETASCTMRSAARSFTLPPGLNHSSLAWISTPGGSKERSRTMGVFPTACVSESRITSQAPRGSHRAPPSRLLPPLPPRQRRERRFSFLRARSNRSRERGGSAPRASLGHRRQSGRSRSPRDTGRPRARRARVPARGTRPRGPCLDRIRPAAGAASSALAVRPSASAGDRRHDGEPVAFPELCPEPLSVAHVLVVAEQVHVPAQGALVVEQFVLDPWVFAGELLERRLDGRRVLDGDFALVGGERAQRGRDLHGHGHGLSSFVRKDAGCAHAGP